MNVSSVSSNPIVSYETNRKDSIKLFSAIKKKDSSRVEKLLKKGANSNALDEKGNSLLFQAIRVGSLEIVRILDQHGADISLKKDGQWTSLAYAAIKNHFDIFNYLLERDCPVIDDKKNSIAYYLKALRLEDYQLYNKKIKLERPQEYAITKEMIDQKMMANAWKIEGESYINSTSYKEFTFSLGGAPVRYCWYKMAKYTRTFFETHRSLLPKMSQLKLLNVMQRASNEAILLAKDDYEEWKTNKILFLNTGFLDHHVGILVYNQHLLICNRGAHRDNNIEGTEDSDLTIYAFRFNPKKLNAQIIRDIQDLVHQPAEYYLDYIWKQLPKSLELVKGDFEDLLENYLTLPPQVVNNCAWDNSEGLVWALTALERLNPYHFNKTFIPTEQDAAAIKNTIENNRSFFEKWLEFQQSTLVEKYLIKHKKIQQLNTLDLLLNEEIIKKVCSLQARSLS